MNSSFRLILLLSLLGLTRLAAAATARPPADLFAAGAQFAVPAAWQGPISTVLTEWPGAKGKIPDPVAVEMVARILANRGSEPTDAEATAKAVRETAKQLREKLRADWSDDKFARRIVASGEADEAAIRSELELMDRVERAMPSFNPDLVSMAWSLRAQSLEQWRSLISERLTARIRTLADSLQTSGKRKSAALVRDMQEAAESPDAPDEAKVAAVSALAAHMKNSYGLQHGSKVLDAITWIGLSAHSPQLQRAVVDELTGDLTRAESSVAVHRPGREITSLTAVAAAADGSAVKEAARDALRPLLWEHSRSISGALSWLVFDFYAPSRPLGFRSAVRAALASVAVASPRTETAEDDAPAAKLSLKAIVKNRWTQFNRVSRWSLDNALVLRLVAPVSTIWSLLSANVPLIPALPAVVLAVSVAAYGFSKHHPLMGLAHMSVITGLFASAAVVASVTGPIGALGYALTFAYAGLLAAVSAWSMRTHRPIFGWLVILAFAALF